MFSRSPRRVSNGGGHQLSFRRVHFDLLVPICSAVEKKLLEVGVLLARRHAERAERKNGQVRGVSTQRDSQFWVGAPRRAECSLHRFFGRHRRRFRERKRECLVWILDIWRERLVWFAVVIAARRERLVWFVAAVQSILI